MAYDAADTIAAVITPPGEGGVAVIRVSGAGALSVAARCFRAADGGDPCAYGGYTLHYGRFLDAATGEEIDDGLLAVFRAPRSYTGEDTAELSCHGGRAVTGSLLRSALHAGARAAAPGEFTLRAFLHGRIDLAQAEAVCDLVRARTDSAARLARAQLDGALSHRAHDLRDALVGILAAIEVTIDFSDEVGELDYGAVIERIAYVRACVDRLLATSSRGRLLREGLRVTLVGRPNVGKSSLMNALLRAERAIVTAIPGTTRDLIEESAQIGDLLVTLTDTAGQRSTADPVEREGIARAENAAASSDLCLLVLEATSGLTREDVEVANRLDAGGVTWLAVVNKSDLAPPEPLVDLAQRTFPTARAICAVSSVTGAGLEELERAIAHTGTGDAAAPESVLVASARHRAALEQAACSLAEAERTAIRGMPGDFIAIDIRGALDAIGQITGETATEDVIHRIFHEFCVGK